MECTGKSFPRVLLLTEILVFVFLLKGKWSGKRGKGRPFTKAPSSRLGCGSLTDHRVLTARRVPDVT